MVAVTREVSSALERCELTYRARVAIDVATARVQHAEYERCLEEAGCAVRRAAAGSEMADSVFVEDIAVVFDELALLTRPGAASRRVEMPAIAEILAPYRPLCPIEPPGTVDGGDVLVIGRRVFIGHSSRTNAAGIDQIRRILSAYGYTVDGVEIGGCLHLKSAATALDARTLLVNRTWAPLEAFSGFAIVDVDPAEPDGANALRVGDTIIYPSAFPRTRRRIEARGIGARVEPVDVSELGKAEGGVTCCSLVFPA